MRAFSLLYRVFYDKKLSKDYIKNGQGWGGLPLLAMAVFFALILSLKVFLMLSLLAQEDIESVARQAPDIVVEKGQIISPENYSFMYISKDNEIFFVFDTTGSSIQFNKLPRRGIYLSKNTITSVSPREIRSVPLNKILSFSDFELNQENMLPLFERVISTLRIAIPPTLFIIWIPLIFIFYIFTAVFYMLISFAVTAIMQRDDISMNHRMRLSVLSIMPAYIFNAVASVLSLNIHLGMVGTALMTLVFMFCFLKEEQMGD